LQQAATGTQQSVEHTQGVVEILAREQKFSAEQAELRRLETVNLNERLEGAEEDRKAMRKDMDDLRNEVRKLMRAKGPQNPEVVMEDPEDDPGDLPEEAPQPSRQASRGWNPAEPGPSQQPQPSTEGQSGNARGAWGSGGGRGGNGGGKRG